MALQLMNRTNLYPWSVWITIVLVVPVMLMALGSVASAMTEVDTLAFDRPDLWWLGSLVPLAGLVVLYATLRKRRGLSRFTSNQLAPMLSGRVSAGRQALRAGFFVLALMFTVGAVIGPRWGVYLEKQTVHGVDIVVALDLSRSMLADDLAPTRLAAAKQRVREQLIDRSVFRSGNRLALLAFAGSTSLRLPLTTDHLAFRTKLNQLQVGDVPRGGTNIAGALQRSIELFDRSPEGATKIIVLVTDGENHEGDEVAEAQRAWKEHGIRVFAVGVGDPSRTVGVQVPAADGRAGKPTLYDGQIVFSKVDVDGLRRMTEAGGGYYVPIEDLHQLVNAIAGMHGAELGTEEHLRHKPRYQWFLAAALLMLVCETMIGEVRPADDRTPQRVWQQEAIA